MVADFSAVMCFNAATESFDIIAYSDNASLDHDGHLLLQAWLP